MRPPLYMRSNIDQNIIMWCMTAITMLPIYGALGPPQGILRCVIPTDSMKGLGLLLTFNGLGFHCLIVLYLDRQQGHKSYPEHLSLGSNSYLLTLPYVNMC